MTWCDLLKTYKDEITRCDPLKKYEDEIEKNKDEIEKNKDEIDRKKYILTQLLAYPGFKIKLCGSCIDMI